MASVLSAFLLSAASVVAAPGMVYTTTYLRAGPGDQYAALDEIEPESRVDVQVCDKGWCRIRSGQATGFINADVLSAPDAHAKPSAPASGAPCFTARLNGRPSTASEVRVCDNK